VLMGLASGERDVHSLTEVESFALSRWLVKTTCVFDRARPKSIWQIHRRILERAHEPQFIPKGFIGFLAKAGPVRQLGGALMDVWPYLGHDRAKFLSMPSSQRCKAAFQYDQIIVGCAWINSAKWPAFWFVDGMHEPFFNRQCSWTAYPPEYLAAIRPTVEKRARGELINFVVGSVGTHPTAIG
jgi:hypothetical protein